MNRRTLSISTVGALMAASTAGVAAELPLELLGCWEWVHGERRMVEAWFGPSENQMLGFNETRVGGESVAWEFLRYEKTEDSLIFHASPSGQSTTSFTLVSTDGGELVFENPEHDFPQRIVYPIPEGDELHARIEGDSENGTQVIHFDLQRFDCAGLWP